MLAMVLYPEAQRAAQEAIDRVCPGRLPTFDDYEALPYIHAIVKEVLRWHPVIYLSKSDLKRPPPLIFPNIHAMGVDLPHRSTKDDTYRQFYIPEGTTVVANNWCAETQRKHSSCIVR